MALQTSGPISVDNIETELKVTAKSTLTLNDTNVRTLFKLPTDKSTIRFSDGYGKSSRINLSNFISSGTYFGYNINVATLSGYSATNAGSYEFIIQANTGAIIMPKSEDLVYHQKNQDANTGASMIISGLTSGDNLTLIMNGCVMGRGGDGGGGTYPSSPGLMATYFGNYLSGGRNINGRPAITIKGKLSTLTVRCSGTVPTTSSGIYGGGGGGAGYDAYWVSYNPYDSQTVIDESRVILGGGGGAGGGMGGNSSSSHNFAYGATTFGASGGTASSYYGSSSAAALDSKYTDFIHGGGGGFVLPSSTSASSGTITAGSGLAIGQGGGGGGSTGRWSWAGGTREVANRGSGSNKYSTTAGANYQTVGTGASNIIPGGGIYGISVYSMASSYSTKTVSSTLWVNYRYYDLYSSGAFTGSYRAASGAGGGGGWGAPGGSSTSYYGTSVEPGGGGGFSIYLADYANATQITQNIGVAAIYGQIGGNNEGNNYASWTKGSTLDYSG